MAHRISRPSSEWPQWPLELFWPQLVMAWARGVGEPLWDSCRPLNGFYLLLRRRWPSSFVSPAVHHLPDFQTYALPSLPHSLDWVLIFLPGVFIVFGFGIG
jgi:hypothetical protein